MTLRLLTIIGSIVGTFLAPCLRPVVPNGGGISPWGEIS